MKVGDILMTAMRTDECPEDPGSPIALLQIFNGCVEDWCWASAARSGQGIFGDGQHSGDNADSRLVE